MSSVKPTQFIFFHCLLLSVFSESFEGVDLQFAPNFMLLDYPNYQVFILFLSTPIFLYLNQTKLKQFIPTDFIFFKYLILEYLH